MRHPQSSDWLLALMQSAEPIRPNLSEGSGRQDGRHPDRRQSVMRRTTGGDKAGAASQKRRLALRRRRGTTLVELVLYLAIVSMIMTFSAGLLREEQVRRERIAFATELKQVISASQIYVAANYERLRDRLLNETTLGQPLIALHPIDDVIGAGFLPQGFAGGTAPKSFAETMSYALVLRAVLRSDAGNVTLPVAERFPGTVNKTEAIMTGSIPEAFRPTLVNQRTDDDEIDLEVLLVTTSDDPCVIVPAVQGQRIASQAETIAAGYITGTVPGAGAPEACAAIAADSAWDGAFVATGPYGGWTLPLAPYAGVTLASGANAVQAGRLVALIALQNRPPLSESAVIAEAGDSAFRCADIQPNTQQELACRQSDLMYSGITFSAWDSDGDGTLDTQPGLENVYNISLAAPAAASGAQIRNVLSLSCAEGETTVSTAGQLAVDCPTTALQGLVVTQDATFGAALSVGEALTVGEELTVGGAVTAEGPLTAQSADLQSATIAGDLVLGPTGTVASSAGAPTNASIILNGQNIEGRFVNSSVQTFTSNSDLTVPKPTCPGGYSASIAAFPVSYEARDLREQKIKVSGTDDNSWEVNLILYVGKTVNSTATEKIENPVGAELFVQTWCKLTSNPSGGNNG